MDFYQEKITTIHDFGTGTERMAAELRNLTVSRKAVVVIPMLYGEIENLPLVKIVDELNNCDFVTEVIIALAAENVYEYKKVVTFFERLKLDHLIVWCNGPRISQILNQMAAENLDITQFKGKGKDAWIAVGIASLDAYAIALHDADIVTYSREFPAKLLYPIVNPKLDFFFNKGYYARINLDQMTMHGRVYRLFVRPFLDTLQRDVSYKSDVLEYLASFRYTLAGEFAMDKDLAMNLRIPADWGLEVGLLAEVYRNTSLKRICQTDLGFYEHKHQEMGKDASEGLSKMVCDIMTTLLRIVNETTNVQVSKHFVQGLQVKYRRFAQDLIRQYYADAICNGIKYNRHEEERYVDNFSNIILESGTVYLKNPPIMQMPDWTRALSAIPDLRERLKEAALADLNSMES